ncbi:MAG: LysE family translocator [Pseudomonadota bacterium]
MSYELVAALVAFAFVTSITPGPNNLMLMASGANFGFWPTLPHMLGIALGHLFMVVLLGVGLIGLFETFPTSYLVLKMVSVAYLTWLAWKIATAAPPKEGGTKGTPMTFLQAAAFQWVNPKAWAMALGAIAAYAPSRELWAVLLVGVVFTVTNLPSISVWTLMGQGLARVLTNPSRLRAFNFFMAALLMLSLWPVVHPV